MLDVFESFALYAPKFTSFCKTKRKRKKCFFRLESVQNQMGIYNHIYLLLLSYEFVLLFGWNGIFFVCVEKERRARGTEHGRKCEWLKIYAFCCKSKINTSMMWRVNFPVHSIFRINFIEKLNFIGAFSTECTCFVWNFVVVARKEIETFHLWNYRRDVECARKLDCNLNIYSIYTRCTWYVVHGIFTWTALFPFCSMKEAHWQREKRIVLMLLLLDAAYVKSLSWLQ